MSPPLRFTEEQIAAAQLRIVVDQKLGRPTPEIVRQIANQRPSEDPEPSATPQSAPGDTSASADDPPPRPSAMPRWAVQPRWYGGGPLPQEGDETDLPALSSADFVIVTGTLEDLPHHHGLITYAPHAEPASAGVLRWIREARREAPKQSVPISDSARAIVVYEALVADRARILGADHPDTLDARAHLAGSRAEAGDIDGAIAELESLFVDRLRILGPDHPATLDAREHLARWRAVASRHGADSGS
ncbi:MAG: hypothetical protein HOV94_16765 [Saccharothrix sp.]|nr:hypothetical protein [Saccharothrix sp.]